MSTASAGRVSVVSSPRNHLDRTPEHLGNSCAAWAGVAALRQRQHPGQRPLQPERLQEVDGIGPKRAKSIVVAWADQKAIREIMILLHSHGVGTSRAVRSFKTYGAEPFRVISENPYRLAVTSAASASKAPI
jgi:ATP-dependent exoDNAse (exonuclease V) alpha subunit